MPPHQLSRFNHLKPRDHVGFLFLTSCIGLTGLSITLSILGGWILWGLGQVLLAVALVQWFILLHECGHETLFRTKHLNAISGHLASFFCVIPFRCWKKVHTLHHKWTGWQDLDPTTAPLIPRNLSYIEKVVINICWKYWIPLFSLIYRINNFWNIPRLRRIFSNAGQKKKLQWNILCLFILYSGFITWIGFTQILRLAGLGFLMSLIFQDPLLLSQHTHIPLNLSHGERVRPYPPLKQEVFTRSLKFPAWFSFCVLLHFDAHELHHMHPQVPGYCLRKISYIPQNEMYWWRWIKEVKRIPGEVFLYKNRDQTGFDV
ncbi:MAG: fatty acid desaturase family protein [Nitrospiria bacterium]